MQIQVAKIIWSLYHMTSRSVTEGKLVNIRHSAYTESKQPKLASFPCKHTSPWNENRSAAEVSEPSLRFVTTLFVTIG